MASCGPNLDVKTAVSSGFFPKASQHTDAMLLANRVAWVDRIMSRKGGCAVCPSCDKSMPQIELARPDQSSHPCPREVTFVLLCRNAEFSHHIPVRVLPDAYEFDNDKETQKLRKSLEHISHFLIRYQTQWHSEKPFFSDVTTTRQTWNICRLTRLPTRRELHEIENEKLDEKAGPNYLMKPRLIDFYQGMKLTVEIPNKPAGEPSLSVVCPQCDGTQKIWFSYEKEPVLELDEAVRKLMAEDSIYSKNSSRGCTTSLALVGILWTLAYFASSIPWLCISLVVLSLLLGLMVTIAVDQSAFAKTLRASLTQQITQEHEALLEKHRLENVGQLQFYRNKALKQTTGPAHLVADPSDYRSPA